MQYASTTIKKRINVVIRGLRFLYDLMIYHATAIYGISISTPTKAIREKYAFVLACSISTVIKNRAIRKPLPSAITAIT